MKTLAVILITIFITFITVIFGTSSSLLASHDAITISLKAQDYDRDVASITFPTGVPGDAVTAPYNNVDTGTPQAFGIAGVAKPVATLVNSASVQYIIWYNITAFTNSVVSDESYVILAKGAACADASAISNPVTFGADTTSLATIAATTDTEGSKKDLYLKITLGSGAGRSGASIITILGEAN